MRTLWIVDTRRVYDWVFSIYLPIAIGVFAVVTLTVLGAVLRYRHRADGPERRPSRRYGANVIEAGYAALLTAVVAFLLYVSFSAEHKVDTASAQQRPALTVDVTGSRWEWTFRYPAYGITRQSGAVGTQPLVVPTNEPVRFRLRSLDVIHSFWIPQLRFKRDAIPGTVETVTLDFDQAGTFSGSCAEYCGLLHSEMVFTIRALTPSAFRAWAVSRT